MASEKMIPDVGDAGDREFVKAGGSDGSEDTKAKGPKATGYRAQKRWHAAHPLAERAHMADRGAERRGLLKRPAACQKCGVDGKVDFHHPDYGQPLVGQFLCRRCHRQEHLVRRAG